MAVTEDEEPQEQSFPSGEANSHHDAFHTKPGCIDLMQHEIWLRCPNQQPIRRANTNTNRGLFAVELCYSLHQSTQVS